nr:elongation of fatty acids protein 3-like [Tanacetum cinerariifolium]
MAVMLSVRVFNHSILIVMSFIWLEYSQSLQVLAIMFTTLIYCVVYGYRFWTEIGLKSACFQFVINCQMLLLGCNVLCHVGVLMLHLLKGGCNGIGAWGFNSVLNFFILFLFLNFYVKSYWRRNDDNKVVVMSSSEYRGDDVPIMEMNTIGCTKNKDVLTMKGCVLSSTAFCLFEDHLLRFAKDKLCQTQNCVAFCLRLRFASEDCVLKNLAFCLRSVAV